jgi:hypothetical protein
MGKVDRRRVAMIRCVTCTIESRGRSCSLSFVHVYFAVDGDMLLLGTSKGWMSRSTVCAYVPRAYTPEVLCAIADGASRVVIPKYPFMARAQAR